MLYRKNTSINSEIKTFFTSHEKAIKTLFGFIEDSGMFKLKILNKNFTNQSVLLKDLPDFSYDKYLSLIKISKLATYISFKS